VNYPRSIATWDCPIDLSCNLCQNKACARENIKLDCIIGEVLFSVLKKKGHDLKTRGKCNNETLAESCRSQIASKTKPDSLRNGTLFVKTISSVWVQQLHFIKEEIRSKLNELSGKTAIKEIRFLVGHTLVQEKAKICFFNKNTFLKKRDREMIAQCTAAFSRQ